MAFFLPEIGQQQTQFAEQFADLGQRAVNQQRLVHDLQMEQIRRAFEQAFLAREEKSRQKTAERKKLQL